MRWAPLLIPLERRMQTLAVAVLVALPFILIGLNIFCVLTLPVLPFYLVYLTYIFFDRHRGVMGTRKSKWVRSCFREYFPAKFVRGAPLDPTKTYVFAAHPHGIISMSLLLVIYILDPERSVLNEVLDHPGSFASHYPNLNIRYVTLRSNFFIPFFREIVMRLGAIDAQSSTISKTLASGCSVLIMVGGAEESLYARPGSVDLVLKKRKGFVRLALKAGASIVPCYSFGENELYDQVELAEGSWAKRAQESVKRYTGVALPLFRGRGIWQYSWGLLPRRLPLITVMGDVVELPRIENPTEEEVDKYHAMYMAGLQALYERNDPMGGLKIR